MFKKTPESMRLTLRALARLLAYPDAELRAQMPALIDALQAEQARFGGALGAAVAEAEPAAAAHVEGVLGVLAVRARDHEAVLVVGDRHHAVHLLDLRRDEPDPVDRGLVGLAIDMPRALEGAHLGAAQSFRSAVLHRR